MEGFQNKCFSTTFHHHFQAKNCIFGYRFHFEGKNDVWISQGGRVKPVIHRRQQDLTAYCPIVYCACRCSSMWKFHLFLVNVTSQYFPMGKDWTTLDSGMGPPFKWWMQILPLEVSWWFCGDLILWSSYVHEHKLHTQWEIIKTYMK